MRWTARVSERGGQYEHVDTAEVGSMCTLDGGGRQLISYVNSVDGSGLQLFYMGMLFRHYQYFKHFVNVRFSIAEKAVSTGLLYRLDWTHMCPYCNVFFSGTLAEKLQSSTIEP